MCDVSAGNFLGDCFHRPPGWAEPLLEPLEGILALVLSGESARFLNIKLNQEIFAKRRCLSLGEVDGIVRNLAVMSFKPLGFPLEDVLHIAD